MSVEVWLVIDKRDKPDLPASLTSATNIEQNLALYSLCGGLISMTLP
jgi:hypothetical protein